MMLLNKNIKMEHYFAKRHLNTLRRIATNHNMHDVKTTNIYAMSPFPPYQSLGNGPKLRIWRLICP